MGKTGGFLEYGRKDPGYRPIEERAGDYKAAETRLSKADLGRQAARCMECGTPFCHTSGCPLSNIIPEFNDLVYQDLWEEALHVLLSTCNFPEFTGRLCPAPCEPACVLGINDDPVTIRQVELSIIETAFERDYIRPFSLSKRFDERVAVIGSGPTGLAVADSLNMAGYNVVVYDSAEKPGGILRYGIPDFKLEKWVIDRRIDLMKRSGIVFEMGVNVGSDISYDYLHDSFDAICLAAGAREPRDLKVHGRELEGIHFAMDYLVCQNRKNAGEHVDCCIDAKDKKVVVIGGGDTGSDCLGTAIRQGASKIYQFEIMPEPPEKRPDSTPWPAWPNIMRKSSSHEEGGERRWSVSTKAFMGKSGHCERMECVEVDCKRNKNGTLDFREKKGSEFEVEAELVLLAMGFVGPGRNSLVEKLQVEVDNRGNIKVDEHNMTSVKGLFAAGDMVRGQSLVVRAIADGRKAAQWIMNYLRGS